MKAHLFSLSLAAVILATAGCATYDRAEGLPPLRLSKTTPERIVLKTEGSPGQSFSAVLTVDGVRREISGVTPAEFPMECVVLVGEVTTFEGDDSIAFMIERHNPPGRFYTPPVKSFRCFRYHSGTIGVLAKR